MKKARRASPGILSANARKAFASGSLQTMPSMARQSRVRITSTSAPIARPSPSATKVQFALREMETLLSGLFSSRGAPSEDRVIRTSFAGSPSLSPIITRPHTSEARRRFATSESRNFATRSTSFSRREGSLSVKPSAQVELSHNVASMPFSCPPTIWKD